MTFNEAIQLLGVSRQTIINYVKRGTIRSQKMFNGRVLLNADDVYKLKAALDLLKGGKK